MKKIKSMFDIKNNSINKLSYSDIETISKESVNTTFTKLTKLFKNSDMTEDGILDIVSITFIIEALTLSELMRDERLSDLEQEQVESLALELYLTLEKEKSEGGGYIQLCDAVNHIIDKHLSRIGKETSDAKH